MRLTLTSLLCAGALAFAAPVQADPLDLDNMSEADRAAFGEQVRAYLLENPEVIFEAIQILEARRNQLDTERDRKIVADNADELLNDGFSFIGGNPDGDITLVEFVDYRCGYCKRAHPEISELLDRDPNIRLVVKDFPILGPDSVKAGKMALAAVQVDAEKFKTLSDGLMDYRGNLTEQVAYQIAAESGYDIAELKEVAASGEIDDRLNRNYQLARKLGLEGTPAFVVGTEIIRGYLPLEDMLAAVQEARREMN